MSTTQQPGTVAPGLLLAGGLRLVAPIGAGGMGEVWRAHDPVLERDVAVKVLHAPRETDDPDATDQFVRSRREARACARVVHPNVVAVHGVGEVFGRPFIAMEWVDGRSLRRLIDGGEPCDRPTLTAWVHAICSAVQHAHDRGVIHCDIKPENILMQRGAGPRLRPKLVDFGLARGANLIHRLPTQQRGTRLYLAPEAGLVRPAPAIDQFALAMTLAELLGGHKPKRSRGIWHFAVSPILNRDVESVLARGLARKPGDRHPDVAAMRDALLAAIGPDPRAAKKAPASSDINGFADGDRFDTQWLTGLPRGQLQRVALAIVATAPAGFEDALAKIAPLPGIGELLEDLAADGLVEGGLGGWALADPGLRDVVLDQLPGPIRRAVARAVAEALASQGRQRTWMRDAAMRLYVGAGDLLAAASMAHRAALEAVTALDRDRRLAEVVALTASPDQSALWLDALLQRLEWLVECGWQASARPVLADALAVASDLGLPLHDPASLRLRAADAQLRLLLADAERAVQRFSDLDRVDTATTIGQRVLATMVRSLVAAERVAEARGKLGTFNFRAQVQADPSLYAAAGDLARASGNWTAAARWLQRALAGFLDRAEHLGAASAAVELAEVSISAGRFEDARAIADDGAELLESLGPVRWRGRLLAARARLELVAGDGFAAMRQAQSARMIAEENGTVCDRRAFSRLMAEICAIAGDAEGAQAAMADAQI